MIFRDIHELKDANRRNGNHWFSTETMRYFGTKIHGKLIDGRYFITSEFSFDKTQRLYTIRAAREDASIETIGEFQAYSTLKQARAALANILKANATTEAK